MMKLFLKVAYTFGGSNKIDKKIVEIFCQERERERDRKREKDVY